MGFWHGICKALDSPTIMTSLYGVILLSFLSIGTKAFDHVLHLQISGMLGSNCKVWNLSLALEVCSLVWDL